MILRSQGKKYNGLKIWKTLSNGPLKWGKVIVSTNLSLPLLFPSQYSGVSGRLTVKDSWFWMLQLVTTVIFRQKVPKRLALVWETRAVPPSLPGVCSPGSLSAVIILPKNRSRSISRHGSVYLLFFIHHHLVSLALSPNSQR